MKRHLTRVDEDGVAAMAEVIVTVGRSIYGRIVLANETADDMVIDRLIRRLSDRELCAAGMYAAFQADDYVGSLLTFEEGRRCGASERQHDDGPGAGTAEAA